jgi:succinate dehydrogenase flavin-adding protein (antitoxin of CptAB toxin-antitoxin module)
MEKQGEKGEDLLKQLENNLDAIYFYVDMNLESMSEEEKIFWKNILEKVDSDFYENKDSND